MFPCRYNALGELGGGLLPEKGQCKHPLGRRYTYPQDDLHVHLKRRTYLRQDVKVDYDPLTNAADYLVVGHHGRLRHLYDPVIKSDAFRLDRTIGRYEIYRRSHPGGDGGPP